MRRIYLIGLGGIGSAYASKLQDYDPHIIKIISDEERIKKYKEGLTINNKNYFFNFVSPETIGEIADLIIISVKYNQLGKAIENIRNFVGENTVILSLLNGISSEEEIGAVYGMEKMLYAMCVGFDAIKEGNQIQFCTSGKINFGEKNNKVISPRVQRIKEIFEKANIPYVIPEDMIRTLWWKFMFNIGINQCTAVFRSPYKIFRKKAAKELMRDVMKEVVDISQMVGVNLNEEDMEEAFRVMFSFNPQNKTSMLQDIEAGNKTEVDMFGGHVCKLGEIYGIDTKVNKTLYSIIKVIE